MTVSELIEELKQYPSEMHIVGHNAYDEPYPASIWDTEEMYFDPACHDYYDDYDYEQVKAGKKQVKTDYRTWVRMKVACI